MMSRYYEVHSLPSLFKVPYKTSLMMNNRLMRHSEDTTMMGVAILMQSCCACHGRDMHVMWCDMTLIWHWRGHWCANARVPTSVNWWVLDIVAMKTIEACNCAPAKYHYLYSEKSVLLIYRHVYMQISTTRRSLWKYRNVAVSWPPRVSSVIASLVFSILICHHIWFKL
jgi:hypothetical protein